MVHSFSFAEFTELDNATLRTILEWRNDPLVSQWMLTTHVTETEHFAFVESLKKDSTKKYWLVSSATNQLGVFYLTGLGSSHVEFGVYLNPHFIGKGYGGKLLLAALDFAQNRYTLSEIHLEVLEENHPAIRVYEKLGFVHTGKKQSSKGALILMKKVF